jgi:hypothetical protein
MNFKIPVLPVKFKIWRKQNCISINLEQNVNFPENDPPSTFRKDDCLMMKAQQVCKMFLMMEIQHVSETSFMMEIQRVSETSLMVENSRSLRSSC